MMLWLVNDLSYYYNLYFFTHSLLVRSICALFTAFIITILLGKPMIAFFKNKQIEQSIRDDGPKSHHSKANTPTMGGILILVSIVSTALIWADLSNFYIWILIFVCLAFGAIGFYDDYLKVIFKNSKGLRAKHKYLLQSIASLIVLIILYFLLSSHGQLRLLLPFTTFYFTLHGFIFMLLGYFVIMGSSNGTNLTDGLDGLLIVPVVMVSFGLCLYTYILTNPAMANFFDFKLIADTQIKEIVIFCMAICGSGIGFLFFNRHPAKIFMGDVGSLSLGAMLGVIAQITGQDLIFFIIGFLFVVEIISVILQVGVYKYNKKRIFRMAPIHHHFEELGWTEKKVTSVFWISSVAFLLLGISGIWIR